MRFIRLFSYCALLTTLFFLQATGHSLAEEKSFYSPVISIDKDKNLIIISNSGAVFGIEVSEAAKPHLDKLPTGTLADFVVEMRPDQPPLLKTWKVPAGETPCKHFDGKTCQ
ncbi:MAG: hypothetical protein ACT4OO_10145 [Nitrospiraceae bacterium]